MYVVVSNSTPYPCAIIGESNNDYIVFAFAAPYASSVSYTLNDALYVSYKPKARLLTRKSDPLIAPLYAVATIEQSMGPLTQSGEIETFVTKEKPTLRDVTDGTRAGTFTKRSEHSFIVTE